MAQQAPATQPAANNGKILVLPFTALNTTKNDAWLGKSIQQSLTADLATVAPGRVSMADAQAPDTNAALDVGHREDSRYVIYGSFVTSNSDMRMTGQVLDVQAGRPIAGIKATGHTMDIFRLEDMLAMQVRQRLGLGPAIPQNPMMAGNAPQEEYGPLSIQQPPQTDQYAQTCVLAQPSPTVQNYYDTYYYGNPYYGSDYGYGYGYGWDWPWWGGVVITSGYGHSHGFYGYRGRGGYGYHGYGGYHGGFGHVGGVHGGFHGGMGGGFHGGMAGGHR